MEVSEKYGYKRFSHNWLWVSCLKKSQSEILALTLPKILVSILQYWLCSQPGRTDFAVNRSVYFFTLTKCWSIAVSGIFETLDLIASVSIYQSRDVCYPFQVSVVSESQFSSFIWVDHINDQVPLVNTSWFRNKSKERELWACDFCSGFNVLLLFIIFLLL